jgi:inorganic pyrophosphatase
MSVTAADLLGHIVQVRVERPLGSRHPEYGFEYAANYGCIPETTAPDGEEIDAYVLGMPGPLDDFTGRCVAVIHRLDDDDDKLVVVPDGRELSDEDIRRATEFQERFFRSVVLRP